MHYRDKKMERRGATDKAMLRRSLAVKVDQIGTGMLGERRVPTDCKSGL